MQGKCKSSCIKQSKKGRQLPYEVSPLRYPFCPVYFTVSAEVLPHRLYPPVRNPLPGLTSLALLGKELSSVQLLVMEEILSHRVQLVDMLGELALGFFIAAIDDVVDFLIDLGGLISSE